jgi:hypothetical protein
MKYVITENRLDKVVDTYITSQLEGLEQKLEKVDSTVNRFVFRDKNGDVVMIILEGMDRQPMVGISEYVYKSLNNLIGLNDFHEIQKYFKKWFKNHMGIDLIAVETFGQGQDEYFY